MLENLCIAASASDKTYWMFLNSHCKVWWLKEHFTVVRLDQNNRMLRIGFGKNEGRWFFRADLWFAGFRITK